jgi:hypothetical protein
VTDLHERIAILVNVTDEKRFQAGVPAFSMKESAVHVEVTT